jgi:prepilin-type N-terminal cleavage/methylation domain-containing protein
MSKLPDKQKGYTIIELMIAATVFSIVLLGASSALIQIGRMYYKGVISSRTQNATRTVIDEISRGIQFEGNQVLKGDSDFRLPAGPDSIPKGVFCIGDKRYTFLLNSQIEPDASQRTGYSTDHRTAHALWREEISNPTPALCSRASAPSLGTVDPDLGEEMLGEGMRLADFNLTTNGDGLWNITLIVVYGDDAVLIDLADPAKGCRGIVTGSQWCAVSKLSTSVYKRIEGN